MCIRDSFKIYTPKETDSDFTMCEITSLLGNQNDKENTASF